MTNIFFVSTLKKTYHTADYKIPSTTILRQTRVRTKRKKGKKSTNLESIENPKGFAEYS